MYGILELGGCFLPFGRATLSRKGASGDDVSQRRASQRTKTAGERKRERPLFDPEASAPKNHYKSIKPSTQPFLTTFNFLVNLWSHGFSHKTARENRDTVFCGIQSSSTNSIYSIPCSPFILVFYVSAHSLFVFWPYTHSYKTHSHRECVL